MINFYTAFGLSFGLGFIITYLVKKWYESRKWLDNPKKSKAKKVIHKKAVPRGGGLAIFLTTCIISFIFLPIDKYLIGIFVGALVITIIGFLDDLYNLHPVLRLLIGFLAAAIVVASGIGIAYISNPFGAGVIHLNQPQIPVFLLGKMRTIWIISDIFALIWIVGVMNFVNWSKGLDGQLPGMTVVACVTIALLSQRFSADITQWETGVLALIIGGAYLGFLVWNKFPQKIMPGYGGGALAGYFLAVLSILSTTKVGTLMVVLGIPLIDAIFVIIRRIVAGKSPIWGDTRHLHHMLLKIGWSKKKVAYFYWLITAILGLIALKLNSQQKFYTIILLILVLASFLLWWKRSKTS
jgi:UDP-GlcNAc:undecaprenyl-phosphate/decaprenyl-phosphate GlcNAc-1-phosphate transferase